ncbi:MAG: four helix bundle protein [Desulfovibrionales bacterium]|nr:MAG: four helix bundle protein [Desulfovibrionales bacterium]
MQLDHEKLDVYRVSLDFAVLAYTLCRNLKGVDRHARDQLLRASLSIPLNIAEGIGIRSSADRGRYLQIAEGSARECGAILDILTRCGAMDIGSSAKGKQLLVRIVAMLTRMISRNSQAGEESPVYGENGFGIDCDGGNEIGSLNMDENVYGDGDVYGGGVLDGDGDVLRVGSKS